MPWPYYELYIRPGRKGGVMVTLARWERAKVLLLAILFEQLRQKVEN